MAAIHETAYPRLKFDLSQEELIKFYTPTEQEQRLARRHTRELNARVCFLVLLKTFQRLGYFLGWKDIPPLIITHIASALGCLFEVQVPEGYDESGTRSRHLKHIRRYFGVKPIGEATFSCLKEAAWQAAQTKEKIPDIVNVMIEELIRGRFELPGFSTLDREAFQARFRFNEHCLEKVYDSLSNEQIVKIDELLSSPKADEDSLWQRIKTEPVKPTATKVKTYAAYVSWLLEWKKALAVKIDLPMVKYDQFCDEAYAADRFQMHQLMPKRRYTYAALLVERQAGKALDSLAQMFVRLILKLHNSGKQALENYHVQQRGNVETLVEQLLHITRAYQTQGSLQERFSAIEKVMPNEPQTIIDDCTKHLAFAQNNYLLCLPPLYQHKRWLLFTCLDRFSMQTSSQDKRFEESLQFMMDHRHTRREYLDTSSLDMSWIPDKWRKLVTGKTIRETEVERVHRRFFELCVLTELQRQLESGDTYIEHSRDYDDYRKHYISWEEYNEQIENYEEISGIPTDPGKFVEHVKNWLVKNAQITDAGFPENEYVRIENGQLIITPSTTEKQRKGYDFLDEQLKARMEQIGILDVLAHTEKWLNLSGDFGQLSGYESRMDNYPERFISTLFCYGCNVGPSETARSIPGITRKQIARINAHHVTEKRLDKAIVKVINTYNKFQLPSFWGSGKTASADGTKWDLYEQNLLSEYHIRYGGYGGIAYYHVSDTYIALFSHFIPCGVYEAIYILDGLIKNASDIQPDTVHGDTHSQSFPVFALAYLLGIKLMPRIRNNKVLTLYHPEKALTFEHLEEAFGEPINWKLIETHLPDMLRVALSVKAGKITPSTVLRRLGTHSRKNKLYYAFRELGRAVRTGFLLEYYHDLELRKTITRATAKSEEFNQFAKWIAFANRGIIRENLRHEQVKIIKYNHLVANLIILYNTQEMTRVIRQLQQEGHDIKRETICLFAPYRNGHINRLGSYSLNLDIEIEPLIIDFQLIR